MLYSFISMDLCIMSNAPERQTVTKEYYEQVLCQLHDAGWCKRPDLWTAKNWQLHHENAPTHSLNMIQTLMAKHVILVVYQPPYSPDIAPCDFWLFPKLNMTLKESCFESREEIMQNATAEMNTIPKEVSRSVFSCGRIGGLSV